MIRRTSSSIAPALSMLCLLTVQASALMSNEAVDQITAELGEVRTEVEKQSGNGGKQDVLRKAFAETANPYVKSEVLEMAIDIRGDKLEPFLIHVVQQDPDVRLRIMAVKALAEHGSPVAVKPLLACAENDGQGYDGWGCIRVPRTARRDAYFALADLGLRYPERRAEITEAIRTLPVNEDGLKDPQIQVQYILTQDQSLLKPFFERLESDDPDIRKQGVLAFRFLKLKKAPKELVALINDPSEKIRSWVALILGEIGDPDTVPVLIRTAKDRKEDRGPRCNAIHSLGRMRAEEAEKVMTELLTDDAVKHNAANALSRITGKRHQLTPENTSLIRQFFSSRINRTCCRKKIKFEQKNARDALLRAAPAIISL